MEDPRYLDGPKLVSWLKEEGVKPEKLTDAQKRRWRDWVKGDRADLYGAVDRILTNHGISMRLIPDDCWAKDQRAERKARLSSEEIANLKREAALLINEGGGNEEIAKRLNLDKSTIRRWRKQVAA